jgi:hypothetical protein
MAVVMYDVVMAILQVLPETALGQLARGGRPCSCHEGSRSARSAQRARTDAHAPSERMDIDIRGARFTSSP